MTLEYVEKTYKEELKKLDDGSKRIIEEMKKEKEDADPDKDNLFDEI